MSNNEKKTVTPEFVNTVKKYVDVDDKIKHLKEDIKLLNNIKKESEEYILEYLEKIEENVIDIADGKLKRNISKSKMPLKKDFIEKALLDLVGDNNQAVKMTEHIIKCRPEKESIKLTRTKNKTEPSQQNHIIH